GESISIKGNFPCLIRSGDRDPFSKAIDAFFPFEAVLTGLEIEFKPGVGPKQKTTLADLADHDKGVKGKISFSEYYGTPAAIALGLEIEDRDQQHTVAVQFRRDPVTSKIWPRFTRTFRPVRSDQLLRPLRFVIRADRLPESGDEWILFQEP